MIETMSAADENLKPSTRRMRAPLRWRCRLRGANFRNGSRSKMVITDVGLVELDVPRDREGTFEPKIVTKRQRRLGGVDEMVLSLAAKGLTTGEISAHLAEGYGAEVSKQTISTITDSVIEGMVEWQNPPLDPGR